VNAEYKIMLEGMTLCQDIKAQLRDLKPQTLNKDEDEFVSILQTDRCSVEMLYRYLIRSETMDMKALNNTSIESSHSQIPSSCFEQTPLSRIFGQAHPSQHSP